MDSRPALLPTPPVNPHKRMHHLDPERLALVLAHDLGPALPADRVPDAGIDEDFPDAAYDAHLNQRDVAASVLIPAVA